MELSSDSVVVLGGFDQKRSVLVGAALPSPTATSPLAAAACAASRSRIAAAGPASSTASTSARYGMPGVASMATWFAAAEYALKKGRSKRQVFEIWCEMVYGGGPAKAPRKRRAPAYEKIDPEVVNGTAKKATKNAATSINNTTTTTSTTAAVSAAVTAQKTDSPSQTPPPTSDPGDQRAGAQAVSEDGKSESRTAQQPSSDGQPPAGGQ